MQTAYDCGVRIGHGVPCPKGVKYNYLICNDLVADTARRVPTMAAHKNNEGVSKLRFYGTGDF